MAITVISSKAKSKMYYLYYYMHNLRRACNGWTLAAVKAPEDATIDLLFSAIQYEAGERGRLLDMHNAWYSWYSNTNPNRNMRYFIASISDGKAYYILDDSNDGLEQRQLYNCSRLWAKFAAIDMYVPGSSNRNRFTTGWVTSSLQAAAIQCVIETWVPHATFALRQYNNIHPSELSRDLDDGPCWFDAIGHIMFPVIDVINTNNGLIDGRLEFLETSAILCPHNATMELDPPNPYYTRQWRSLAGVREHEYVDPNFAEKVCASILALVPTAIGKDTPSSPNLTALELAVVVFQIVAGRIFTSDMIEDGDINSTFVSTPLLDAEYRLAMSDAKVSMLYEYYSEALPSGPRPWRSTYPTFSTFYTLNKHDADIVRAQLKQQGLEFKHNSIPSVHTCS